MCLAKKQQVLVSPQSVNPGPNGGIYAEIASGRPGTSWNGFNLVIAVEPAGACYRVGCNHDAIKLS